MGRTIETIRPPHQRGAAFRPLLGLTVSMSLRLVIPWRVALQQRPPPLHQPVKILKQEWQFEKSNYSMASVTIENCLNRGVHPKPFCALCAFLWLNLLREDRGLAPANRLRSREAVLMHDAEVPLRLILHLVRRMALEPE